MAIVAVPARTALLILLPSRQARRRIITQRFGNGL
jgi:hypothetical protein